MTDMISTYSPIAPLGEGAFAVDSEDDQDRLLDLFKNQKKDSFLIYGQRYWEYVPVPKASNPITRYGRQLLMLFRQFYSKSEYLDFNFTSYVPKTNEPEEAQTGIDFFCQKRAKDQVLYKGKTVRILYPDSPVVDKHYLIVTKAHRESLMDLSHEEFREVVELAKKVGNYFEGQKHILMKAGFDAGQTVPHFHLHLMITLDSQSLFWGQLRVLRNILLGWIPCFSSRLRGKPLANSVEKHRPEVQRAAS